MGKDWIPYHRATKLCKQLAIFDHFFKTMPSHDSVTVRDVKADLCVEVLYADSEAAFWNFVR